MGNLKIWRFTDRLPNGNSVDYCLEDHGSTLVLRGEPASVAASVTAQIPLKILKYFIETNGEKFDRDKIITKVWPEAKNDPERKAATFRQQLFKLRDFFEDRQPKTLPKGQKESGRLFITVKNPDLWKFGGHEIQLPVEEASPAASTKGFNDFDRSLNESYAPLLEGPFASAPGPSDFTYYTRATSFIGRDAAMDALRGFLADERLGCWTVVSGPAGAGKSRLAAELIEEVRSGSGNWKAGFLVSGDQWLNISARKWHRESHTLIVVDHAGELSSSSQNFASLQGFLSLLGAPSKISPQSKMRVILIDRLPPDAEEGVATLLGKGFSRRREIARSRWEPRAGELNLEPLSRENALAVAQEQAGGRWSSDTRERIDRALTADAELARPLFALLIGEAIRSGTLGDGVLNPVTVAEEALNNLFTHRPTEFLSQAKMLWAAATACQGIAEHDLLSSQSLIALTGHEWADDESLTTLHAQLRSLSGSTSTTLRPLVPDFLGSLFVVTQLAHLPPERSLQRATALMSLAWAYGANPGSFLVRMTEDLINLLPQIAHVCRSTTTHLKELMSRLVLSGLHPEARVRQGAEFVVRCIHMAYDASRAEIALEFIAALDAAYSQDTEDLASPLARAWFGFTGSTDSHPAVYKLSALTRIQELFDKHNSAELGWLLAVSLSNASMRRSGQTWVMVETDPSQFEQVAGRIAAIWQKHNTEEIALCLVNALTVVAARETDPAKCADLARRIEEICREYNTVEMATSLAGALCSAAVVEPDPAKCEVLADRIGGVRREHNTDKIALEEATALCAMVIQRNLPPDKCEELARRIWKIWRERNTAEIAKFLSQALYYAALVGPDPDKRERLVALMRDIQREHDMPDVKLA
jgi:hypothetical protein